MAPPAAKARADQVIRNALGAVDRVLTLQDVPGSVARREMLAVLREADRALAQRLARLGRAFGGGPARFTESQALAYQQQIRVAIDRVKRAGVPITQTAADGAMAQGVERTIGVLAELEGVFRGVGVPPAFEAAMRQSSVLRGTRASLFSSVPTSFDRYGAAMAQQFQKVLRNGLLTGMTVDQMTDALVRHGGPKGLVSLRARKTAAGTIERILEGDIPEGLFQRHRYWAERIVRTEVAYAYNGASHATLQASVGAGLPLKKKILAHFDNRTAADSIAVHGQVRDVDDLFQDGAGRRYKHPPARPNDRETVIPWSEDWDETPSTRPPTKRDERGAVKTATGQGTPRVRKNRTARQVVKRQQAMTTTLRLEGGKRARAAKALERAAPKVGRSPSPTELEHAQEFERDAARALYNRSPTRQERIAEQIERRARRRKRSD